MCVCVCVCVFLCVTRGGRVATCHIWQNVHSRIEGGGGGGSRNFEGFAAIVSQTAIYTCFFFVRTSNFRLRLDCS